jgi:hypothetical protein
MYIFIHIYIYITPWLKITTSTLNYTCVLTLTYGHGEQLMYIVFDDGECTCKLLRTGLCSLRTATAQVLILCNHRPVGCLYPVAVDLAHLHRLHCMRKQQLSRHCWHFYSKQLNPYRLFHQCVVANVVITIRSESCPCDSDSHCVIQTASSVHRHRSSNVFMCNQ